jgi:Tol biopolymer transport system component
VLFTASVGGRPVIAGVAAEGGPLQELGLDASTLGATSDGSTIVFSRAFDGLWKLTAGARQPERLVDGSAFTPIVTPDNRNVIFLSTESGLQSPWIVPLEGGNATEIVRAFAAAGSVDISRDGQQLLFVAAREGNAYSLVVCELPECDERRDVDLPSRGFARFMPDGRVAYVDAQGDNIWSVAIDGGAPLQLTSFADAAAGPVAHFAWSPDGERLAIVRMTTVEDIVLLSNLRRE